jgi:hypothetical protein
VSASVILLGCAQTATVDNPSFPINTANMSEDVKIMASDDFMGRAPGTEGETKTVNYLIERFTELGLEPGGRNGEWTHPVALNKSAITIRMMRGILTGTFAARRRTSSSFWI